MFSPLTPQYYNSLCRCHALFGNTVGCEIQTVRIVTFISQTKVQRQYDIICVAECEYFKKTSLVLYLYNQYYNYFIIIFRWVQ